MDFIIADNQEITRFAVEHLLVGFPGKRILHASKKTELIEQLKEHEQSVVIIDYTLFDFLTLITCSLSVSVSLLPTGSSSATTSPTVSCAPSLTKVKT